MAYLKAVPSWDGATSNLVRLDDVETPTRRSEDSPRQGLADTAFFKKLSQDRSNFFQTTRGCF